MFNFWLKLVTNESNKLSSILYRSIKQKFDNGSFQSKWLENIKETLEQLDLGHVWNITPNNIDMYGLKKEFEHRLHRFYKIQWLSEIELSGACSTYNIFKSKLELEPYLTLLDRKYSIPISKFRSNNHKLPIVTGRYNGILIEKRICDLCDSEEIADEYHYLLKCPYFHAERIKFIDSNYINHPNILSMKKIMNSVHVNTLLNLSKFVSIIMEKFSSGT